MSNSKISALTSASTPLAGTEVLPIVQTSTTKQVAVNDLTVRNIRANATTGILQITGPAAASTRVATVPDANWTAARTDASQSFTGDQTLSTGNLIQGTAAKGVNFTANTAMSGSTSRLLNWYEEGVFTATVSPSTSGTVTLNSSYDLLAYTRIGRKVTIQGQLIVSSVSSPVGFFYINFPFAISSGLSENAGWVTGSVLVAGGTSAAITGFALLGSPGESAVRVYLGTGTTFSATSAAQLQANASITISLSFII